MKLIEKVFLDLHDFDGKLGIVVTIAGTADEMNCDYLCVALLEKYVERWGFHVRDLEVLGKCFFDTQNKRVTRTFIYRKNFPPRYFGNFFNQEYTPEVKRKVEGLRKKADGYMKCDLDIG